MVAYRLTADEFLIEDYHRARPFASFLPGIAGLWGIPMWAFYVNRGQAIAGFGVQDKDHPIMEFQPANRAYRSVPLQGFRTFLNLGRGRRLDFYEPFRAPIHHGAQRITQRLRIRMHDLVLEETNATLGLDIRVQYFTLPHEPLAGLVRMVTLTNRSSRPLPFQLVDGLPVIIPHGMLDRFLKNMSRTIEAWVTVDNLERRAPFYHLKVEPHDRPEVVPIRAGNFFAAFVKDGNRLSALPAIIDPAVVFGRVEDDSLPERFVGKPFRMPAQQCALDRTPCAMAALSGVLHAHQTQAVYALYGHADSVDQVNRYLQSIHDAAFFVRKAQENRELIDTLTRPVTTKSRSRQFDAYCRQTFLDNVMRGGTPVVLGEPARRRVLYVYSRKHGDLERDYNHFVIPPTHFSQGNANYRDVNQNRRNDAWFTPQIGAQNIVTFFNLLQADGFNPLIYKGTRYVPDARSKFPSALREGLVKSFTPGELLKRIERRHLSGGASHDTLLSQALAASHPVEDAEHGEGFWTDHWTYNLDLLESYLALYPERLRDLLLTQRVFTFYDNPFVVVPRAQRYRLMHGAPRQYHAVVRDAEKDALIRARAQDPHTVRVRHGRGDVYRTVLLVKMVCVIANKLASLDPHGIGVEMEADKPNWFDALNGLPALFGSSVCETFELKRWIRFVLDALDQLHVSREAAVELPEELAEFIGALRAALLQERTYWQRSHDAKERYRKATRLGFSGTQRRVTLEKIAAFLREALPKVERGIRSAFDAREGLYRSYFTYTPSAVPENLAKLAALPPAQWKRHALPLFLEGNVHALRVETNPRRAQTLHRAVRRSPLYDRALGMYRVCAPLEGESEEIGRCRIFTPGWLEHQSIWLHMEYKYLLELLRAGLYEEFQEDFFRALIPFQPPSRYGRSTLENSSFLVSSVYPDRTLHGGGFVARLSGATAEFLHLWLWMTAGKTPFALDRARQLTLRFDPILPKELFDGAGRFTFRFLGRVDVTYRNPSRRATFGAGRAVPRMITLHLAGGGTIQCHDGLIPAPHAAKVRDGDITRIDVELAPAGAARPTARRRRAAALQSA